MSLMQSSVVYHGGVNLCFIESYFLQVLIRDLMVVFSIIFLGY